MRSVKKLVSIMLIFLLGNTSCSKDTAPNIHLICAWPENYRAGEVVTGLTTRVVTARDTLFVFESPKIGSVPAGFLYACNMPREAKKSGINVKISGHLVTFDLFENAQFIGGYPFEITKIEYLDK